MSEKLQLIIDVDTKSGQAQVKALGQGMGSAADQGGRAFRSINTYASQAEKTFRSMHQRIFSLKGTLTTLVGGYGLKRLGEDFWEAGLYADRMSRSLDAATGSSEAAAAAQAFLRSESERLGLVVKQQIQDYKTIAAAAKGTSLEGWIRDIYTAVAEASTALQLSEQDTSGALVAISQMISKGSVQAEELRGQLGERLPGAFQIAAKAMGVTTAQLSKMLDQGEVVADVFLPRFAKALHERFAKQAEDAAQGAQGSINRFKNTWFEMETAVMQSGALDAIQKEIDGINKEFKAWLETNRELIRQKVPEYVSRTKAVLKGVWDIISYDPAIIEYGLVGLAIGGKKGAALIGGMGHMMTWAENLGKALGLAAGGVVKLSDVTTSANFAELDALVARGEAKMAGSAAAIKEEIADLEQRLKEAESGPKIYATWWNPTGESAQTKQWRARIEEQKSQLAALEAYQAAVAASPMRAPEAPAAKGAPGPPPSEPTGVEEEAFKKMLAGISAIEKEYEVDLAAGTAMYQEYRLGKIGETLEQEKKLKQDMWQWEVDEATEYDEAMIAGHQALLENERAMKEEYFAQDHEVMDAMRESWGLTWEEIRQGGVDAWADIGQAVAGLSHELSSNFAAVITGAKSGEQAMRDLGRTILATAIETLIQIGMQKLLFAAIEAGTIAATTKAQVASMTAITAAAGPAAMMVSIATEGEAAAAGSLAFAAAMAAMTAISMATISAFSALSAGGAVAAAAKGGIFDRPTLTLFGEEGPEAVVPLSPHRRDSAQRILAQILPMVSGGGSAGPVRPISVDVHFYGDVKLDANMDQVKNNIGEAIERAIRSSL